MAVGKMTKENQSAQFMKEICLAIEGVIIAAILIALLCGWEWRKPVCATLVGEQHCPVIAPAPAPKPAYRGHVYTPAQQAMFGVCDIAFTHYVKSGAHQLEDLHNRCKAEVLPQVKAMGAPSYKDYVKLCVIKGTRALAEQKEEDGDQFHSECVDHITSITQNITLLHMQTGADEYATGGKFQGMDREIIVPNALKEALAEAKADTEAAKAAKTA